MCSSPNKRDVREIRSSGIFAKLASGHLVTVSVSLVGALLVPRSLGPTAFGLYSSAFAVVVMLEAFVNLGLQQVGVRFVQPLWKAKDRDSALELGSTIWCLRLVLATFAGAIALIWLARVVPAAGLRLSIVVALFCVVRIAQQATLGLLLPLWRFGEHAVIGALLAVTRPAVVLLVFPVAGLTGVFVSLALVLVLSFASSTALLRSDLPVGWSHVRLGAVRPYLGYSFWGWTNSLATAIQSRVAVYAIATRVSLAEAGLLAVAVEIAMLLRGLSIPALRSQTPILIDCESQQLEGEFRARGEQLVEGAVAAYGIAVAAWILFGDTLVEVILGRDFEAIVPVTTVLLIGVLPWSIGQIFQTLLCVRRDTRSAAVGTSLQTAVLVGGLVLPRPGPASRDHLMAIAWVYFAAACVYAAANWIAGVARGLKLLLWRSLGLVIAMTVLGARLANWEPSPLRTGVLVAWIFVLIIPSLRLVRLLGRRSAISGCTSESPIRPTRGSIEHSATRAERGRRLR